MDAPAGPGAAATGDENAQPDLKDVRAMFARDKPANGLGITVESVAIGAAVLSMSVREDMINIHGSCHGGVIFMLADTTFGMTGNFSNTMSVATSAEINFVNAAFLGDHLTATCQEQFLQGRNGIYDVKVTNQHGDTIALFRGKSRSLKR